MIPISTGRETTLFVGPAGVDPLPVEEALEQGPGVEVRKVLRSVWHPTDDERTAIALGSDVVLEVLGPAHPAVRLLATNLAVENPERVYSALDAVVARGSALAIVAVLASIGIERTLDAVLAWSEDDRRLVSGWLAATEGEGTRPEILR